MSEHHNAYALLKSVIDLSTSSLPIETRLEEILQTISKGFQSDRCLFLRPEKIIKNGFLSCVAQEKKPLCVDEDSFFQGERVLSEEKDLHFPTFACIPLYDQNSFEGILHMGFSKNRKFSLQEIDLLLLIAKEIEGAIRYDHLHQKEEETISELAALQEMGKAVSSTLKLEELLQVIVNTGLKILKARGGVLRVEDKGLGS